MKRFLYFCLSILLADTALASDSPGGNFHVYAASRSTSQLWVVRAQPLDTGLNLKVIEKIDLGFPGSTITTHPERPLLYVAAPFGDDSGNPAATIELDEGGGYLRQHRVNNPHGYAYLSLDRTNSFLLGANYRGGQIDVFALDENGRQGKRVAGLDEGRVNAHCVLTSPDNQFVYIPYVKDTNGLFQYRFDANTGNLTPLTPKSADPPQGTGPRHMAYHPSLPMVYFSNEQHVGISVYEKMDDGQLDIRQVCDALDPKQSKDGVSASDIVITPDGGFLFAGMRGKKRKLDRLSRYQVMADGSVEFLGLTPVDEVPWGLTLSPDGRYLLASAFGGATLTVFKIGENGELDEVAKLNWDPQITDLVTR